MLRFRATLALTLAGSLSTSATGAAQPERTAQPLIQWEGDADCARPADLEQQLAARLGPDQAALAPAEFRVEVRTLTAGGYALSLLAKGQDDARTREVELATCADARRAAVMLIATALTAEAGPPAEPAHEEPPPEQPPWSLRGGGLFDVRSVPQLTGGLALGAGYRLSQRFQLWADARYLFARDSQVAGARADIDLFALGLGAGMTWSRARWSGGPLLELELGALRGRARQNAEGSDAAFWLCPWGGASVSYSWARVGLALAAQLGVPLVRARFSVDRGMASYRTEPVTGRAQLTFFVALGTKKSSEPGQ